jgi:carbamoyltransferase
VTYILGISAFYHDSSATLLKDGLIIAAVQEERFTRKKHDPDFPKKSIEYLLKSEKITLAEVQSIVFYEKPFLKFERLLETYVAFAPKGFLSFLKSMPLWIKEKLFQKNTIKKELQEIDSFFEDISKIKFSEHHLSHAASAFFPSPFEEAAILTMDGVGEWATTTIAIGKKNRIEIKEEINFPHSLGLLYSAVTFYLGFKVNSGEYKVMGLAPYGTPKYKDLILEKLLDLKDDGSFKMNMNYFDYATGLKMTNQKFSNLFGRKRREPEIEQLDQFHMDIAASVQAVTEEIVLRISKYIKDKYKLKNFCMSGGVALNCVANGVILRKKIFENIWIQPASGDAGGSLGAAQAFWFDELNNTRNSGKDTMNGSYLGPCFSNKEINIELSKIGANFIELSEEKLLNEVSKKLSEGNAVGWFQGRMEFGPRALGCRSIIADPRNKKMQKQLNLKVKFRESFRPFAPSILKEKVQDYFDIDCDSPYMLLVAEIKQNIKKNMTKEEEQLFGIEKLNIVRSDIPAVTHVDYTSRIQTVCMETNPKFYKLLNKFNEITGYPILINTSFNVRGEPIVCSIEDAYKCFMGTDMDILVCENTIMYKNDQDKKLLKDYKNKYELD